MLEIVELIHKLITIRVYMDSEPSKAKQLVTNWIKELEQGIKNNEKF